jgi:dolichyl-phosphate-mannose-protein mannosyltransferase
MSLAPGWALKTISAKNPLNRGAIGEEILFLAHLPIIAITLLLGLSIYEITRQLAGTWGGALALTLFVTSPFFLSYGTLVLTDVPVVLFAIWAMWYFASLWQEPTRRNALMFSLSLAGALLTKFNAVFLFPALLLCWIWFQFSEMRVRLFGTWASLSMKRFRREGLAIGGIVLAGLAVYVFYLGIFPRTESSFGNPEWENYNGSWLLSHLSAASPH